MSVKSLSTDELNKCLFPFTSMDSEFCIVHEILARHINDTSHSPFRELCYATSSNTIFERITHNIISFKADKHTPDDEAVLLVEKDTVGSSWNCNSYYALQPNGEIDMYDDHSYSDDTDRNWDLFD